MRKTLGIGHASGNVSSMSTQNAAAVPLNQPLYGASFGQAVQRFFKKYATFSGRASRSEYWWVELFVFLVNLVLSILLSLGMKDFGGEYEVNGFGWFMIVVASLWGLALIVPHLALTMRRLHDANFSGWFILLGLIPGGAFVIFIFTLIPSNPAGVRYDEPQSMASQPMGY